MDLHGRPLFLYTMGLASQRSSPIKSMDRMRLIGPKCDQLGPIIILNWKSPNEKTSYHM